MDTDRGLGGLTRHLEVGELLDSRSEEDGSVVLERIQRLDHAGLDGQRLNHHGLTRQAVVHVDLKNTIGTLNIEHT